jgi:hypothetical protein
MKTHSVNDPGKPTPLHPRVSRRLKTVSSRRSTFRLNQTTAASSRRRDTTLTATMQEWSLGTLAPRVAASLGRKATLLR